ncbi:MAG: 1-(5-phosphoribosyl)-5-[(5-phosphoribosylamino)methylideneamino] imidazole-4-carboxamide isomerase [Rubricoccaceae bacterium]|nr:1-(5-phosphoribosyl)-5-[(5-phosphoribosylamino)methylideneamino] imidazole-4-carboxamide isomerase [Rubricoccaceae bacterium]
MGYITAYEPQFYHILMLVIPAIDIRRGVCVRHREGFLEDETDYFADPVRMAKLWRVQNAKVLHLANLDAALDDAVGVNKERIARIADALDIPVQVGGGIKSMEEIEWLFSVGVYRVVVGTMAVHHPEMIKEAVDRFGASKIIVGVDAENGHVRTDGRSKDSGLDVIDHAMEMERLGVRRITYTDISREGTLSGPNIPAYRALAGRLNKRTRITAAGGVSGYKDLLALQSLESLGVDSVIIGRALYENKFPCQQFWCWHDKEHVDLDHFSSAPLAG